MVIQDLSLPEKSSSAKNSRSGSESLPLASVTDRFIAFILDFLILSPVVSFSVSGILRNLKTVLILNSDSEEAVIIWALFIFGIVGISSLLQAMFFYFWQATPGQRFMQLQVISYPQPARGGKKLNFAQGLLRPLGWWLGVLTFGIPFMEILGHPLRRAFHERVSDTLVISLKQEPVDIPLAVESRYITSTMWIVFAFMFVMGMSFMAKSYRAALKTGLAGSKTVQQASCPDIPADKYKEQKRLDLALALYFAEEVDEACVYTEAQNAVWNLDGEDKALGQLAMSMITEEEKEATAYKEKVCVENAKSEACAISNYLSSKDEERGNLLRRSGLGLVSSRLLLLKNSMDRGSYVSAMALIRDLEIETPLASYLNKNLVRAAWALNNKVNSQAKNRAPASGDEQEVLQEFKKRFEIK